MKTAVLAFGYWSQNIGNAFFQVGGMALLQRLFGRENVARIQDVPAHWTLNRKSRGNPETWWPATSKVEADYVVFQGPSLDRYSHEALDTTLAELVRRGVEPIFLGIGLMRYSPDEIARARTLIDRHRIRTVVTRDERSFAALDGRAGYSGIDSAFYVPWAVDPPRFSTDPYVALSFERILEPEQQIAHILSGRYLDAHSSRWAPSSLLDMAGRRSQALAYIAHRYFPRRRRTHYGVYEAVRLVHRTNPAHMARIFRDSNVVAADEPYTYLATYANARLTLTDRVHACVVSLAYGTPAMMWFDTPRNALLERLNVEFPMSSPVSIERAHLERERFDELEFLRQALL